MARRRIRRKLNSLNRDGYPERHSKKGAKSSLFQFFVFLNPASGNDEMNEVNEMKVMNRRDE